MYLTGARQCKVDAKGRMNLPADFRREFDDRVCLVPVSGALHGFTPEGHKAWVDSFFPEGFNPRNPNDVKLRRALNSRTDTVEIDSAGRVCLGKVSAKVREGLALGREVAIVGNGDHFEVWDAGTWEKAQEDFTDEDLDALMFGDPR